MKTNWKWILGLVILLVIVFFLPTLFHGLIGTSYGPGMMSGYGWQRSADSGWHRSMMGFEGFSPFGGLLMGAGMLFAWIIPLGLLFLAVYGAIALYNRPGAGNSSAAQKPAATESVCKNCGEAVETGWIACPHCGEKR